MFVTNHVLSGVLIGGRSSGGRWRPSWPGWDPTCCWTPCPTSASAEHLTEADTERFLRMAKRDGLLGLAAMAAAILGRPTGPTGHGPRPWPGRSCSTWTSRHCTSSV